MIILTLTQKDKLSENLVNIMTEIEDEILHKIARQLAADNNISDTSKWRIRQLARSGQLKRESLELIKSYSGIQSESLYDALQTAAIEEVSNVDRSAREAIKNGLLSGSTDIPADRTAENALKAYYKQAKSDLNMVNTVMGYQASQAFVNAVNDVYGYVHKQLDKGTAKVVTGSESLQTAIRETIKDLSKHGIPAFVDKRGHHWSPESYVRMDLRTTLGNTANAAQWSRCDQFGINLISVDSHSGSRPLCAPYQGRIFSRDGTFGVTSDGSGKRIEYSPLSSTSYGQPAGLFGINCGHSSYPFIPGINIQRYFPVDPEENAAKYKELQKQRQLEREIRAGKRECMMLQAAGDEEGYKKAALRLRTKREQYRVYSNAHDLSLHNDRTQVYGFDHSKSMKTVWAEKKAAKGLTSGENSGTIKPYEIKKSRTERKAIIEKVKSQERPIFAEDTANNKFASNVRNVPPKEGYYDVALHGTPTYAEFFGEKIDAYTLAKIIKSRDDYVKGTKIRLLSCSTGNTDETGDCFAQLLANELGVEVEAPTKTIWVHEEGNILIGDTPYSNNGEFKTFYSRK